MATELSLDTDNAKSSLKSLTNAVKESSNEAKILENQYKSAGNSVAASKAKYEGLTSTIEAQKTKVDALKKALETNNNETEKGKQHQAYLTAELGKAEIQLNSYQGKLERATQAYKYQESGLAKLNQEVRESNDLTKARVERLEAEGNKEEAQKVKLEQLKNTQENYTKQLQIQKSELNQLAESGDKSSSAYKRQELRVEQMGAKLARTKSEIRDFNHTDIKPETTGISKVKGQLESLNDKIKQTHSRFGSIFLGNLVANGVTNALGAIKSKLGEVISAGSEYVKYQSTMKASWDTLTGSAKQGDVMVKQVNDMAQAASNSTEMVDDLSKKLFAVTNSAPETGKLTKSILTLQDAFGVTDDAVKGFGMQWSQMVGNGKVSAQDFMSFTNVFPKIKQQLLEYEQQQTGNHKLSMQQLNDMISNGKISSDTMNKVLLGFADKYKDATQNFASTIPGLERTIKARMPAVVAAFEQPLMKMKNPLLKSVGDWVSDKNTEKEFTKLGNSLSKSLGVITKAFGSEFKGFDFNKGANGAIDSLSRSIEKFGDYVAKHKDDIVDFFKMVKSLGASGFSTLGLTLKITLPLLEDLGRFAAKHPTTFKVLAASVIGFNLALKGTLGTMVAFGKAKSAFMFGKGLFIKPRVDGSSAKRELGIISKMAVGLGKSFLWTAKLAGKTVLKTLEGIGGATIGIGKGFWWTAKLSTKAAKLALSGLLKAAKVTGAGMKAAFNFAKANPLFMIVTAVVAVSAALYELYKHNKKFRSFVNSLIKGVQDFFKGVSKWMGKVWSTIKSVVKSVINVFKKDWKAILLLIVNPFAGAFALVYKHNKTFRNAINGLAKAVKKIFTDMWKSVKNIFGHLVNDLKHSLYWFKNVWKKVWNTISDFAGDVWNGIKRTVVRIANALWSAIRNSLNHFFGSFKRTWNNLKDFFGDVWNGIKGIGSRSINSLKDTLGGILGKIGKTFSNTWNGIKDGFKAMWEGMKRLAADGINAVIKIPNAGIDGINSLIHDFGGPKRALGHIPKVAFANGTGAIDKLTHAVLNDGNDSPETGNKETIIHPNGKMEIVQGQNTERLLLPGTEILNAKETAMFMGMQGIKHFANGTGFWGGLWNGVKSAGGAVANVAGDVWDGTKNIASSAWSGLKNGVEKFTKMFKFITDAVAHPAKTLGNVLSLKSGGISTVMDGLASGAFKKVKSTATDWWSELWSMANDSSNSGASGSNKGDDYLFKNKGADAGTDPWGYYFKECVSFVASRLKNMGVSPSLFTGLGNGSDWVHAKVKHTNKPKPGDVAVYSAGSQFGNHVAMVSSVQGGKISGEEYNFLPTAAHKYHTYSGRPISGATTFLDFGKSMASTVKDVASNSGLASLIKKQTGGMMAWIQKWIAPLNDSSDGSAGNSALPNGSHKNWLKQAGAEGDFSKWNYIINHESGWNPKAKNPGSDAYGIGQALPPSKMAKFGGDYMSNPITQLKWMKSYVNERYGGIDGAYDFWKSHHWYANGGLVTKHQVAEIGEGNQPEMIIPLDGLKSSRGYELLGKTMSVMAARDNLASQSTNTNGLEKLEAKFDSMIQLLGQLVQGQANPTPAYVIANQASQEIDRLKGINNRANRTALG